MFWLIISLLAIGLFLFWFSNLDCDFVLWLYCKYGYSIDKFHDKVIWITGASSGIGEHLAYVLAKAGAKLVLSATSVDKLEIVGEECRKLLGNQKNKVLILPMDITDCDSHQEKFDNVLKHFKKLDILVNNAGRSQRASFLEIEHQVDRQLFDVNVFGLVNLTRVVLRYFLEFNPDGQFGVTSSTAGILGAPYSASYTASKHALHGYFECLRTEVGKKGIGITMFCVGPTFSNLLEKAFTGKAGEPVGGRQSPKSRKMSTERCAHLMAIAMANKIEEAWISIQPVLTLHYLSQYYPTLFKKFFPKFYSEDLQKKIRDGPGILK